MLGQVRSSSYGGHVQGMLRIQMKNKTTRGEGMGHHLSPAHDNYAEHRAFCEAAAN